MERIHSPTIPAVLMARCAARHRAWTTAGELLGLCWGHALGTVEAMPGRLGPALGEELSTGRSIGEPLGPALGDARTGAR
jgi:hypothetical protein